MQLESVMHPYSGRPLEERRGGRKVPMSGRVNEVSTMRQYYAIGTSPLGVERSAGRETQEQLDTHHQVQQLERGFETEVARHLEEQTEKLQAELKQERIRFETSGKPGTLSRSAVFQHILQTPVVKQEHGPQPYRLVQVYSPMGYARTYGADPARVKQIVARHMDELHQKLQKLVVAHNRKVGPYIG